MEKEITFYCPAQKTEYNTVSREAAFKLFRCEECVILKNKRCTGAVFKNLKDRNEAIRQGLNLLSTQIPKSSYGMRGRVQLIVKEFYDEIVNARMAGHGWGAIAKAINAQGYNLEKNGNSLSHAFNKLKNEAIPKKVKSKEAVK